MARGLKIPEGLSIPDPRGLSKLVRQRDAELPGGHSQAFIAYIDTLATATKASVLQHISGRSKPPFISSSLQTPDFMRKLYVEYAGLTGSRLKRIMELYLGIASLLLEKETRQEHILIASAIDPRSYRQELGGVVLGGQIAHILELTGEGSPISVRIAPDISLKLLVDIFYLHGVDEDAEVYCFGEDETELFQGDVTWTAHGIIPASEFKNQWDMTLAAPLFSKAESRVMMERRMQELMG